MKKNNFNIIRFLAAALVFAGHIGNPYGRRRPSYGKFSLQEIGVSTLFIISGYLITKSWLSDPIRFVLQYVVFSGCGRLLPY